MHTMVGAGLLSGLSRVAILLHMRMHTWTRTVTKQSCFQTVSSIMARASRPCSVECVSESQAVLKQSGVRARRAAWAA